MREIVGIQFKNASRVYYFDPVGEWFTVGDYAIVETVRGLELGKVIIANRKVEDDELSYELKPIIRKAGYHDVEIDKKHEEMAPKSFAIFKKYVSKLNLEMKPLYCEYTIDSSKIVFYYSADDRVDFRELLKYLTPCFKQRIELRQIGLREAARIVGGIGNCGRIICCKSCLNNFDYVTMKMAKDQNMSLNIAKISGLCGKLMCCIGFEHGLYTELKKILPNVGEFVTTPSGTTTKVVAVDYVKKIISTQINPDAAIEKFTPEDLNILINLDPLCETDEDVSETDSALEDNEELEDVILEEGIVEPKTTGNKKIYKVIKKQDNSNKPKGKKKNKK